jgi:hypothetical protein
MQLFLIENRAKPLGSRIVAFGATVFVTDEFCYEARSTFPPYLGLRIAQHYLTHNLPILSREQIARANARNGLNVMMCFGGWEQAGLSREEILAVREKQSEAFHLAHSGYRVKEFLADPIGEKELGWMLDAGAHLRRDYSDYFRKHGVPIPESSQRPWLVGLTKEEALANPGSHLSSLFVNTLPRFHFNHSEHLDGEEALALNLRTGCGHRSRIAAATGRKRPRRDITWRGTEKAPASLPAAAPRRASSIEPVALPAHVARPERPNALLLGLAYNSYTPWLSIFDSDQCPSSSAVLYLPDPDPRTARWLGSWK